MITVDYLKEEEQIKSIITDPILWKLMYGQGHSIEDFKVNLDNNYLGIWYKEELCGMMEFREFNQITLDAHIFILPKFHKTTIGLESIKIAKQFLKETTNIYKVITTVPLSCEHVHKFLAKTDFKVNGKIDNAIIFDGKLQDIIIYSLDIREV